MFIIDANILITPSRLFYPHTMVPGYWSWLAKKFESNEYILLDRVANEIVDGDDDLSKWVKKIPTTQLDEKTLSSLAVINNHVSQMGCTPAAVNEFFRNRVADQFLIAFAHAHGHTVISEEAHQRGAKKRVLIPNVCVELGIDHQPLFPWLHSQGLYLVEGSQRHLSLE